MDLFSSNAESLPVVDAVSVIVQYVVDREERPAQNIAPVTTESHWRARVRAAAVKEILPLYDPAGVRVEFKTETFESAHVKLADLAQWLVDTYKKAVVLDGVRVKTKQVKAKSETLKRKILVKRYRPIWPSIDADLQEGCWNGLDRAAALGRGYYDVRRVLEWGRRLGRLSALRL